MTTAMRRTLIGAAAALTALTAQGQWHKASAQATNAYDGFYEGLSDTIENGSGHTCALGKNSENLKPAPFRVKGGQFTRNIRGVIWNGIIHADGSVSGTIGSSGTFKGQATATGMTLTSYGSVYCPDTLVFARHP